MSHKINYWRTKSGTEVDFIISGVKPVQSIEVKSGILKQITIGRGYRSFLSKYAPPKAILLNSAMWSETEIAGHTREAIPTAVFLLKTSESESLESLRPLHNPSIVIASEAKQSHNTLISHEIAASLCSSQ